MQKKRTSNPQTMIILEQIALLITSFIWTAVVLGTVVFFWIFQDLDANWGDLLTNPEPPQPGQTIALANVTATPTPWQGPPPTTTPTETLIPTATGTTVVQPPLLLPETLNIDDPIPVIIHTDDEITDYVPTAVTVQHVSPTDTPIPTSTPTPIPPTSVPATATPIPQQPTQSEQPQADTPPTFTATLIPSTDTPVPPTATPIPPTATAVPLVEVAPITPNRLLIPSVNIDTPVIPVGWHLVEQNGQQYSIWDVADYAVGWHNTTALPGQAGNTVMAGHHNINGEVFRELVNVEVGDEVVIYQGDAAIRYQVEVKTIVKEKGEPIEVRRKNAEWIAPTDDERITMVTCWPYTSNTHRVIVVAKPVG